MSHRILITGASGYLGGTLLNRLATFGLPSYDKLFALVRTNGQADAVREHMAEPLCFDAKDETAVHDAVVDNKITIVFFLIDAASSESQSYFIKALVRVHEATGHDVHFLHTSGAKLFSSHAGAPIDGPFSDATQGLYQIQKTQKPLLPPLQPAIDANSSVIELGNSLGVHTYIFVPCIVYGVGEGFGNKTSIQTVAVVKAAQKARRVYDVNSGKAFWPVCHVVDNTNLYLRLLQSILAGENPDHGKDGYYLAASGSIAWADLYSAIAMALAKRGAIEDSKVELATEHDLDEMAAGLGCPRDFVALQLGGTCMFTAEHGKKLGWEPCYPPIHILDTADEEVELILTSFNDLK